MTKKLRRPKSKTKPRSLLYATLAVIAVLLGILYTFRPRPTPIQIAEITNTNGTVNLSLASEKTSLLPNESTTVTLRYDSPADKLTAIEGEITYDPAILTLSSPTLSGDFPTQFVAPKIENGKLTFTAGVKVEAGAGLQGQGTVLTFQAKAKSIGQSNLSISSSTLVLTTTATSNTLREVTNTTLAVTNPATSSEPSNTASASPSHSASASPSTSPSTSPNTSPSTSPTTSPSTNPTSSPAADKPASPTNLRYNCYNNGNRITLRWNEVVGADSYKIIFDQKDGDHDQNTTSTRAEKDLDLKSNTNYTWKVASVKNNVVGDYTTLTDIKCNGESVSSPTPTPTPTPAPTATPAPTKKSLSQTVSNIFKPKSPTPTPAPSIKASPSPLASFVPSSPLSSPGSLADIFASPSIEPSTTAQNDNTSFFAKILIGWQALFIRIVESITR